MEFPELGTHCAEASCSRLDFLPFDCDACHKIFCKDHKTYEQHNCKEAYSKDVRVPVCPLCNQPVPVNRGEDPNTKVDEHIQKDCQSDKAKKMYTNRCSVPGCKKKELVPVTCNTCHKNFCLKHRFETNHDCQGHPNRLGGRSSASRGGSGSTSRSSGGGGGGGSRVNKKPQMTTMSQIGAELNRERLQRQQRQQRQQQQRAVHPAPPKANLASVQSQNMSEDEALAMAIAASMNDPSGSKPSPRRPPPQPQPSSYEDDEALARAIAASLNEQQPKPKPRKPANEGRTQSRNKKSGDSDCSIS